MVKLKGSVNTLKSLVQSNKENQVCGLRVALCAKWLFYIGMITIYSPSKPYAVFYPV